MTATQARHALLALFFCATLIELAAPRGGLLALNILFSFLTFLWYCRDRDAHGRRRSLARNIGIILLPFLAIPWYVMRHQSLRGKVHALLRFVGFIGLMLAAALMGALLTALGAGMFGVDFAGTLQ
jgi:hypothetical protein